MIELFYDVDEIVQYGKGTIGLFYRFKLHYSSIISVKMITYNAHYTTNT
ncbi:hypothetical protein [Pseudoalteromonas aliena]|nr:hypothetical protein [Pseudoalteromonas aliena]